MKDLPKPDPEFLIEQLRERARETADDVNEGIPEAALKIGAARIMQPEDMLEWWAADCIEDLLAQISPERPPRESSGS